MHLGNSGQHGESPTLRRSIFDILIAFWMIVRPDTAGIILESLERGDLHGILWRGVNEYRV